MEDVLNMAALFLQNTTESTQNCCYFSSHTMLMYTFPQQENEVVYI